MQNFRKIVGIYRREGGYTLMELVMVMIIIVILSVVVVDIIYLQAVNFDQVFNRSVLLSEWRKALAQLRIDVQELAPGNVTNMEGYRLTFYNFDGQTIDYEFKSNELSRNGVTVAKWVQSDPFKYLDNDEEVTTDSDSLNFIQVTLDFNRDGKKMQLSEVLYIRN